MLNQTVFDPESERGVLHAMTKKPRLLIPDAEATMREEWFFEPCNRILFREMVDAFNEGQHSGDLRLITVRLKKRKLFEEAGGEHGLQTIWGFNGSYLSFEFYAGRVKNAYLVRQAQAKATQLAAVKDEDSLRAIVRELSQLVEATDTLQDVPVKEVLKEWSQYLEDLKQSTSGIRTGIESIDSFTGGLQAPEMVLIAGETSKGKSALAIQILGNAILDQGIGASVFSFEMHNNQVLNRMISNRFGVDMRSFKRRRFLQSDLDKFPAFTSAMERANVWFHHKRCASIDTVISTIRRHHDRYNTSLAIADYIQLIEVLNIRKSANRQDEIALVSGKLKALAKELNILIIGVVQLNSDGTIFGCRQLKRDCDTMITIQPPLESDKEREDEDMIDITLAIEKGRNIGEAKFPVTFDRINQTFTERTLPTSNGNTDPRSRRCYVPD